LNKKLLGGIKVFRQLDSIAEESMKKELAHIGVRCAVDCGRVVTSEFVANKSLFKVMNGLLDLADEMNEEFLSEKVVVQADMVKLADKNANTANTTTVNANAKNDVVKDEELERIEVPSTKVE
jgi:hypothetical protein